MIEAMKTTAQWFKALSEEVRLRILALLSDGELCVCDMMAVLELPQSTISRHLAYLRNAGLVEGRRQDAWVHYRLVRPVGELAEYLTDLPAALARCEGGRRDLARLRQYQAAQDTARCTPTQSESELE